MNVTALSRIRKPLRILLTLSILVAALCLMGACLWIYHSGAQPFSRESVAVAFRPISIPVWLCVGLAFLALVAEFLMPPPEESQLPARQLRMLLKRMQDRTDLSRCSDELRSQVMHLRSDRKLYNWIGWIILSLSILLFLLYGLNKDNYHPTQITQSIMRSLLWLLPCTLVPFFYGVFSGSKNHSSMAKELELLKSAPKESRIPPVRHAAQRPWALYLRMALLVVGFVFLVYGAFTGGTMDVLTKAANICTECIGLG